MKDNLETGADSLTSEANRLTFYKNWFEAAVMLPDDLRLVWYETILSRAFPDVQIPADKLSEKDALAHLAIMMTKATMAASERARKNGSKSGGNKSVGKVRKPRGNPHPTQTLPTPYQEQIKEQIQIQEQNATTTAHGRSLPTVEQFVEGANLAGVPEDFARGLYEDLRTSGWADANGVYVGNWRRYLKTAWNSQEKNLAAREGCVVGDFKIAE